jgi:glycosyltransferase involved in cell wall biosynthesis
VLDFQAWFCTHRKVEYSWEIDEGEWDFLGRYITRRDLPRWSAQIPVDDIARLRPDLFVSGYSTVSYALGSLAAKAVGSRISYRVVANYEALAHTPRWKQGIKHFLFRVADGAKVPGTDAMSAAEHYGVPRARICQVQQSIDVSHYSGASKMDASERALRRRELRLHGCVFVYTGRLVQGKGLDDLIVAYRQIQADGIDVSLLMIGEGTDEERYRAMASNCQGIVFTRFVQPAQLPSYYALGDVFVFPSLGEVHGLAVDEAMAAGLPVVASSAVADIRARVIDGESGYVVPPKDPTSLADRMRYLANDLKSRRRQGLRARQIVHDFDHEAYARDFEKFVDRVLSLPTRRTLCAFLGRALGSAIVKFGGSSGRNGEN